jgi:hypothetical protein
LKVAPGIHRIGDQSIVNVYLLEDAGEVTIIDAGVPGYYRDIPRELAAMGGRSPTSAPCSLPRAHRPHRLCGAPPSRTTHPGVGACGRRCPGPRRGTQPGQGVGPITLGPLLGFLWFTLRRGGLGVSKLHEVTTFGDGATLDVPGSPRVS